MKYLVNVAIVIVLAFPLACKVHSPKRDQIPALKVQLVRLQTAILDHNRAAIDSLLSPKILEKGQNSDSLMTFVYGLDSSFPFEQFGGANIIYTKDKARIECAIMDTTGTVREPVTFFLAYEHDMWLFTGYRPGPEPTEPDTTAQEPE